MTGPATMQSTLSLLPDGLLRFARNDEPAFVSDEGWLRNLQIVPVARISQSLGYVRSISASDRGRLPARGFRQGRDRARPPDGVDGAVGGDDAAGAGARDRHRAGR